MNKTILFHDKSQCCGCGACCNVCPRAAITMTEDEYGFLYPLTDEDKCVKCGLCREVCAYQDSMAGNKAVEAYAAVSKVSDLSLSASGGVFSAFAVQILGNGGCVYGAACAADHNGLWVQHVRVDTIEHLSCVAGSKYVQSSLAAVFQSVRRDLEGGKEVLFSGTPCQCAALRKYLKKREKKLLLMDIVCHGVPNIRMLNDYIRRCGFQQDITQFQSRTKIKGWGRFVSAFTLRDNSIVYEDAGDSSYYYMFLNSYLYRDSCYTCKYAGPDRSGDITIGDYWGIEEEHPCILNGGMDPKKGISCLIVNNQQGKTFLDKYGHGLFLEDSSFEKIARHNAQLNHPCKLPRCRKRLLAGYKKHGYSEIEKYFNRIRRRRADAAAIKKLILQILN